VRAALPQGVPTSPFSPRPSRRLSHDPPRRRCPLLAAPSLPPSSARVRQRWKVGPPPPPRSVSVHVGQRRWAVCMYVCVVCALATGGIWAMRECGATRVRGCLCGFGRMRSGWLTAMGVAYEGCVAVGAPGWHLSVRCDCLDGGDYYHFVHTTCSRVSFVRSSRCNGWVGNQVWVERLVLCCCFFSLATWRRRTARAHACSPAPAIQPELLIHPRYNPNS
jgi:hypothetical protein